MQLILHQLFMKYATWPHLPENSALLRYRRLRLNHRRRLHPTTIQVVPSPSLLRKQHHRQRLFPSAIHPVRIP